MISRRNIRVKVMQTLYTLSTREQGAKTGEPVRILQNHFDQSKELFLYLTYFITEIGAFAEQHAYQRSSKHLPTKEDLNINTKISGNELLWKIREDISYQQEIGKAKPEHKLDKGLVKKLYLQLVETEAYKNYLDSAERIHKDERNILLFLFDDLMITNEDFMGHIEEHFMNWDDDADMVIHLVHEMLQKPVNLNFREVMSADKWDFAKNLIITVSEKQEHLETLIFPKLKNWDAERIAALDMIIMKMGVAEFLYFDTIPPKVTINEYIDVAKEYSTEQSGQFVNGILDNIHKELVQQDKLHKTDFKKKPV
ncbi:MAG: transcription antitermination factor NusB [Flavisolibacter sp.]|jgi:N utilization substance protein B|nr:transcription antitermination factor NusB [Flavisolibacter sp.]